MMLSQKQSLAGSRQAAARTARAAPVAVQRRGRVCRATESETKEGSATPESFQENSGFVAYDSAGQSNMYPVYTKAYAGNSPAEVSSANASYAVGAAGVAIAVIALGIIAIGRLGGSEVALGDYKTLTEYAAIFAAQI